MNEPYPDCIHQSTYLSEEGYECHECGLVLGHSWGSINLLKGRAATLRSFIDEGDGPARWFLDSRRELRAITRRIERLESEQAAVRDVVRSQDKGL